MGIRAVLLSLVLFASPVFAAQVAAVTSPDKSITISLQDGPCQIAALPPDIKKVLSRGALWTEGSDKTLAGQKKTIGCWGYHPNDSTVVVIAWADESVTVMPRDAFKWAKQA